MLHLGTWVLFNGIPAFAEKQEVQRDQGLISSCNYKTRHGVLTAGWF